MPKKEKTVTSGCRASIFRSAVVFTTHERSGYFTSVLGENIDLRLDPRQGDALHDILHNIIVAGGNLVVIDEAFFIDVDAMAFGLEQFVKSRKMNGRLKIIVVCAQRKEGDALLAFLVGYCGIYNIIYDSTGVGVSIRLSELLRRDNMRADVIELIEPLAWQNMSSVEQELPAAPVGYDAVVDFLRQNSVFKPVALDQHVEVDGMHGLHVHIELSPEP